MPISLIFHPLYEYKYLPRPTAKWESRTLRNLQDTSPTHITPELLAYRSELRDELILMNLTHSEASARTFDLFG